MTEQPDARQEETKEQTAAPYATQPDLRLTRIDGGSFRLADGVDSPTATATPPSTVLGRSPDADVEIIDPSERVSRCHLILEAKGATWWAHDDFSGHGTWVRVPEREPSRLPPGLGVPLENGLDLHVAGVVVIRLALKRRELRGKPTAEPERRSRSLLDLATGQQLPISEAIVRYRNAERAFRHLIDLGLITSTFTAFRRTLRELANHPAVRDSYGDELARRGKDPSDETILVECLASALHRVFPTLDLADVAPAPTSTTSRTTVDSLLTEAQVQLQGGAIRGAGATAGVALERHLGHVAQEHGLSPGASTAIGRINDALYGGGVYDTPRWRQIQLLADIRNVAVHHDPRPPDAEDVSELIRGVRQVVSAVN